MKGWPIKLNGENIYVYLGSLLLLIPYIYTIKMMGGVFTYAWVLISLSVFCQGLLFYYFIRPKLLRITLILSYFIFLNVLHFRYFEGQIRLGEIYSIGNVGFILNYIPELADIGDLLFLISFMLIIYLLLNIKNYILKTNYILISAIILIILSSFSLRLFAQIHPLYSKEQNISSCLNKTIFSKWNRLHNTLRYGFIASLGYDLYYLIAPNKSFEKIDGRALYLNETIHDSFIKNPPDIFMIQVESLDFNIINKKCNGFEITPFLNNLASKSYFFTKFYAQHTSGGGTSDTDFSTLTSFYPLGTKPSFIATGHFRFASLPFVLKQLGYQTAAFHDNNGGFWGRSLAFNQLGFNKFFSRKAYNSIKKGQDRFFDHEFFEKSFEIIKGFKRPIFAYLITLTSHGPYKQIPSIPINTHLVEKGDNISSNYFRVINYVDKSLFRLVKKIKQNYKNYIIIIYGDHTAEIEQPSYKSFEDRQFEKIPLFIISSQIASYVKINNIGTHLDIPPTILYLLGSTPPSDWQGVNLFKYKRDLLILKDTNKIMKQDETISDIGKIYDRSFLYNVDKYLD